MSNKEKLSNKELKEVSGGISKFVAEVTDVKQVKAAVGQLSACAEETDAAVRPSVAVFPELRDNANIGNSESNDLDDLFKEKKSGLAAIIEEFIKSLKKLFKF